MGRRQGQAFPHAGRLSILACHGSSSPTLAARAHRRSLHPTKVPVPGHLLSQTRRPRGDRAGRHLGVGPLARRPPGATLRPGIELLLDLVGFHDRLDGVVLVVTGEGSLDEQTLHGKAPAGVARAARAAGVETVAVCGRSTLAPDQLRAASIGAAYPLLDLEPDPRRCMREAAGLLERVGARIAEQHAAFVSDPDGNNVEAVLKDPDQS